MVDDAGFPRIDMDADSGLRIDSDLAHDLANVLAAALASARLLQRKAETDETRELAEIVLRQLDKATAAIHAASRVPPDG